MQQQSLEIVPFTEVGPLRFGLPRASVRSLLGPRFDVFKKGFESNTTDAYDCLCLHVFYDDKDVFECLTGFGTCPISYKGIELLNVPIEVVLRKLQAEGLQHQWDDGYFFEGGGFALFESDGKTNAVTVYSKRCFESVFQFPP